MEQSEPKEHSVEKSISSQISSQYSDRKEPSLAYNRYNRRVSNINNDIARITIDEFDEKARKKLLTDEDLLIEEINLMKVRKINFFNGLIQIQNQTYNSKTRNLDVILN